MLEEKKRMEDLSNGRGPRVNLDFKGFPGIKDI